MHSTEADKAAADAAKVRAVDDENRDEMNRDMPGRRAARPEGAIPPPRTVPQSDENRDQPVAPDGSLTLPAPPPATDE
jgi:hypothetical protein